MSVCGHPHKLTFRGNWHPTSLSALSFHVWILGKYFIGSGKWTRPGGHNWRKERSIWFWILAQMNAAERVWDLWVARWKRLLVCVAWTVRARYAHIELVLENEMLQVLHLNFADNSNSSSKDLIHLLKLVIYFIEANTYSVCNCLLDLHLSWV